jgi:hypothetical protein
VIIGTAFFGDHTDNTPCCAAEGSIVKIRLHFELLDGVGVKSGNATACRTRAQHVADTHAIEFPIVVVGARSVHVNPVIGRSDLRKC